jgi:hypothetical protein
MNSKSSIDYLKLQGAQVMSVEINGKPMNCVVIPVAYNGITVTADKDTGLPNAAYQNLREWETSQKYKDACMANNTDKPDYIAPSHSIDVSYPEALEASYKKRYEVLVREDATFMASNPSEEDIKKEASNRYRRQLRIGTVTPLKRAEPQPFTGQAQAAASTGAWVPPPAEVNPDDDLPF